MRKNTLAIAALLAALSTVSGCSLYDEVSNSTSEFFTQSAWDEDKKQYVTDGRGD
jgi:hypothetical protein